LDTRLWECYPHQRSIRSTCEHSWRKIYLLTKLPSYQEWSSFLIRSKGIDKWCGLSVLTIGSTGTAVYFKYSRLSLPQTRNNKGNWPTLNREGTDDGRRSVVCPWSMVPTILLICPDKRCATCPSKENYESCLFFLGVTWFPSPLHLHVTEGLCGPQ
jgi:hypothetical protein